MTQLLKKNQISETKIEFSENYGNFLEEISFDLPKGSVYVVENSRKEYKKNDKI